MKVAALSRSEVEQYAAFKMFSLSTRQNENVFTSLNCCRQLNVCVTLMFRVLTVVLNCNGVISLPLIVSCSLMS